METYDYQDAMAVAAEIIEMIEEELPDAAYAQAKDFFDDVLERVEAVYATIEANERVTDRQMSALVGWRRGVQKWIH